MNKTLFCILTLFLFTGCTRQLRQIATPTNFENFPAAATQIAITSTKTENPIILTPQSEEIDLNTKAIFRDDFNSPLSPKWMILNENQMNWGLDKKIGFLEIDATGGYFNLGNASNVFLLSAPLDNFFIIETRLLFDPEASDQFAGLLIAGSNHEFVQVGVGYCPKFIGCSGRGLYIDIYNEGKLKLPRNTVSVLDEPLLIRLIIKDKTLRVFISEDEASWFRIFEQEIEFIPQQVGLIASQNNESQPEIAYFDYFEIQEITP